MYHFHSAWKYSHLCHTGQDEVAVTKLLQTYVTVLQEKKNWRAERPTSIQRQKTSSRNPSRCPSSDSLGDENRNGWNWKWCGKNEAPSEGDTKNTKPMNAICSHSIIQHLLLTLCHLHPFVLGHLRDSGFQRQMMSSKPTLNRPFADICFSSKGECIGLVCSRTAAHCLARNPAWVQGQQQDNGQPSGAALRKITSQVHGFQAASLGVFSEGAGLLSPGFASWNKAETMKRSQRRSKLSMENKDLSLALYWHILKSTDTHQAGQLGVLGRVQRRKLLMHSDQNAGFTQSWTKGLISAKPNGLAAQLEAKQNKKCISF